MLRLILWCKPISKYLLVVWLMTIIVVSSTPNIPTLKIHPGKAEIRLDYLMHFFEYGLLGFLAFLTFAGNTFKMSYKKYLLIAASLIIFAFLDELHQKFIPGRSYNLKDFFSNMTGIVAALVFCLFVFRIIEKRV
jgi:VanZ family protein